MNMHNYIDKLLQKGYKLIGSGLYAKVYYKENCKHVIKVGNSCDNYLIYIDNIKNKNNPLFPKIHSIKKYKDYYVVKMEKLNNIRDVDEKIIEKCKKDININSYNEFDPWVQLTKHENKHVEEVVELLSELTNEYANNECGIDIGEQNIMVRKNKNNYHLVLTDPIC